MLIDHPQILKKPSKPQAAEQEVLDYIAKFASLNEMEVKVILENINIRTFKKGTTLLREGQVSTLCYFVLQGCVRQYYLVDGEEKTTEFYTVGQPITGYEGTLKKVPSKFYLSCVEDSILTVGTEEEEKAFYQKFPQFESICRVAVEDELAKNQAKLASYIIHSPEERYLHLMETRPELLDRVPQHQLASYLGIKPESLSRIRRRIMDK